MKRKNYSSKADEQGVCFKRVVSESIDRSVGRLDRIEEQFPRRFSFVIPFILFPAAASDCVA